MSGWCRERAFSDFGHDVICIDRDEEKIAALRGGKIPIHEPGLAELVASNVRQDRLAFDDQVKPAVAETVSLMRSASVAARPTGADCNYDPSSKTRLRSGGVQHARVDQRVQRHR
jgi:UDP-glucose 6-dehydrogenase